jgi:Basic region leucine zipper
MCKIIPSAAALAFTTQSGEAAQDFDAWFETINKELPDFDEEAAFFKQSPKYPFEMDMPLPELPLSEYSTPFSTASPPSGLSTLRPVISSAQDIPPIDVQEKQEKPIVTVQYVTRPAKANNVKRSTPDDPITEEVALKRQKQNEAARKCRLKRLSKLQECEKRVEETEKEKFELSVRVAVLEKEKEAWILKEQEMNLRIDKLRAQLDHSHRTLMHMN